MNYLAPMRKCPVDAREAELDARVKLLNANSTGKQIWKVGTELSPLN